MKAWVPRVQEVHREAFEGTHTFYPPTDEEIVLLGEQDPPSLIKLVMKGESVIGFIFGYHNITAGIQKFKGR